VETSTNRVIQKLGGVGLVDAYTGERVELGENVLEAYYKMFGLLNRSIIEQGEVGFESAVFTPISIDSGDFSSLTTLIRNYANISQHIYLDIVTPPTNLQYTANFTILWHGLEVTPTLFGTNATYTLDIGNLGSGDLYGTAPSITVLLPVGTVLQQFLIQVILRTDDGVVDQINLLLTVT